MNTRRLIKRIQAPVIWAVAIMFGAGVVWWGIAAYMGGRNQGDFSPEPELTLADAVAVLTKNDVQLDEPIFWVSFREYETAVRESLNNIRQQGMTVDPYFGTAQVPGEMGIRYEVLKDLLDQRILRYYAKEQEVLPSSAQIQAETKRIVDDFVADSDTRNQIIQYYGSVNAFTDIVERFVTTELLVMNASARALGDVDEAFREHFEANRDSIRREYENVTASHILTDTEQEALELKTLIESGEISFADAAVEYSVDAGSAPEGGDLGTFGRGQMIFEFEEAAFNASVGEIVGPVETQYGHHLIQVRSKSTFDSLEDLQSMGLYEDLKNEFTQQKFTEWFTNYKASGNFGYELNDPDLLLYDKYEKARTDPDKTEELLRELALDLFPEDDDESVALMESYLPAVVFVQLADSRLNRLDSTVYDLEDAIYYYETLPEDLLDMSREEIEEELEKLPGTEEVDEASDTEVEEIETEEADENPEADEDNPEEPEPASSEPGFSREDLEEALKLKDIEDRLGISSAEEARSMLDAKSATEAELEEQFKRAVRYLYNDLPFSSTVLEYMYRIERDNPEVVLRYHENNYDKNLSFIISNRETFQMYLEYYQQFLGQQAASFLIDMPVRNMEEDLLSRVVRNPEASDDLKVTALYLLIEVYDRLANLYQDSAVARVYLITQRNYLEKLEEIIPGDEGVLQTIELMNIQIEMLEEQLEPEEILEPEEFETELELEGLPGTLDELDNEEDFELDIGPFGTE